MGQTACRLPSAVCMMHPKTAVDAACACSALCDTRLSLRGVIAGYLGRERHLCPRPTRPAHALPPTIPGPNMPQLRRALAATTSGLLLGLAGGGSPSSSGGIASSSSHPLCRDGVTIDDVGQEFTACLAPALSTATGTDIDPVIPGGTTA